MNCQKVFLIIFLSGVFAHVFSLLLLPDGAYNDSLYHFGVSEKIIEQQNLLFSELKSQPPVYQLLLSGLSIASGFEIRFPFTRILPLLLNILFFGTAFLLFKKIFSENFLVPLSFLSVFSWLGRLSGANYTENLSIALLMASLFFLLKLHKRESIVSSGIIASFLISAFALTRLNAALVFPVLFLFLVFFAWRAGKPKLLLLVFFFSLLLVSAWFYNHSLLPTNENIGFEEGVEKELRLIDKKFVSINILPEFYFSFFDLPPNGSFFWDYFSFLPSLLVYLIFFIVTFPLCVLIAYGAKKMLFEEKHLAILLVLLILLLIGFVLFIAIRGTVNPRYFLLGVPLLSIFFGKGFVSLKKARKLFCFLFLLFALFCVIVVIGSTIFYFKNWERHSLSINYVKALPVSAKVFSFSMSRHIEYYGERESGFIESDKLAFLSAEEKIAMLKENSFSHLLVSCYKERLSDSEIIEMEKKGFLKKVYFDSCARIFEIR